MEADRVVAWPTLFVAADWIEQHCVIPDGFREGEPFELYDWQAWFILNHYRVKPGVQWRPSNPILAPAFHYRRSQLVLPQKAGKGPLTAAQVCLEGVGPSLFGGWAKGGERWDCRDHGCGCGWIYEYEPGEAMGLAWPTPLIQITATSEDQTGNIYDALRPMIDKGPLTALIPKTGEEFIRLPNGGRIDIVTSNARSRLGQRVTFVPQDETGQWTQATGMIKVAETQRRGLAGMGGRAVETTNCWDPSEDSVAQRTSESKAKDIFQLWPQPPGHLKFSRKDHRRKIYAVVYAGSTNVDLDAIEAEAAELMEKDPAQGERFFGNRVVTGGGKAWDPRAWLKRFIKGATLKRRTAITLGFDGSRFDDSTALVATDIKTGIQFVIGLWEHDGTDDWQVPTDEVDAAVDEAFKTYRVIRFYCDPPYWEEHVDRWIGRYGAKRVIRWWTNRPRQMCWAVRSYTEAITNGDLSHDGDEDYARHIGNAYRRPEKVRDDKGNLMWTIKKETPKSPLKIDICMAGILSWEARGDAIAAGELKKRGGRAGGV